MELDSQESPGEIKSREVELDSPRELDNPLLQLFLDSCFLDVVFVTLFRTAAEKAISEVDNFVVLAVADDLCGSESADELFILPPPSPTPPPSPAPLPPGPHQAPFVSPSLISRMVSVDVMYRVSDNRAQELCESRGGRPGLPVPNSHYGLCGRKATLNCSISEVRSCVKVEVAVLGSIAIPNCPYGLRGRKATMNSNAISQPLVALCPSHRVHGVLHH